MRRTRHALVILFSLIALVHAAPALAGELDDAKRNGQLGEQADGYVGVVKSGAPAGLRALADKVNQGRRSAYAKIAKENGIPVEAVAARAGEKLVRRAPAGEYVKDSTGGWKRK